MPAQTGGVTVGSSIRTTSGANRGRIYSTLRRPSGGKVRYSHVPDTVSGLAPMGHPGAAGPDDKPFEPMAGRANETATSGGREHLAKKGPVLPLADTTLRGGRSLALRGSSALSIKFGPVAGAAGAGSAWAGPLSLAVAGVCSAFAPSDTRKSPSFFLLLSSIPQRSPSSELSLLQCFPYTNTSSPLASSPDCRHAQPRRHDGRCPRREAAVVPALSVPRLPEPVHPTRESQATLRPPHTLAGRRRTAMRLLPGHFFAAGSPASPHEEETSRTGGEAGEEEAAARVPRHADPKTGRRHYGGRGRDRDG